MRTMQQTAQALPYSLLVFLLLLRQIAADCNVCNVVSNQACVSKTEYKSCKDNTAFGQIYTCNANELCTLSGKCEVAADDMAACDNCGVCSLSKSFACTGTKTFALCLGSDTASAITGTCSDQYVCSIDNPNICGDAVLNPATCSYKDDSTTQPPSTTPSAEKDPKGYCAALQQEGRFPVGANPASTCKQYVRCILHESSWISAVYYCPGGAYFDSTSKTCVTDVPARCRGTVLALSLYNMQLV